MNLTNQRAVGSEKHLKPRFVKELTSFQMHVFTWIEFGWFRIGLTTRPMTMAAFSSQLALRRSSDDWV